jgi:hypothetical protein
MKNAVFWDVAPGRYCINRRFGRTYHFHLQASGCSLQPPAHAGSYLADFFIYPEDGGDTFLRNVCLHNIYTAPHHRRIYLFCNI